MDVDTSSAVVAVLFDEPRADTVAGAPAPAEEALMAALTLRELAGFWTLAPAVPASASTIDPEVGRPTPFGTVAPAVPASASRKRRGAA